MLRPLAGLTRWIGSHLVLFGFIGFAAWGYAWREPLLGTLGDRAAPPPSRSAGVLEHPAPEPSAAPGALFRPAQPAASDEAPARDAADLLQAARRAYWNGELEAAEERYRLYLGRYPDDPAGYGELGNLLHSMGREPEAQQAFREAATRLRAIGEEDSAVALLQLLGDAAEPSGEGLPE